MSKELTLKRLQEVVQEGDPEQTVQAAKDALDQGVTPIETIEKGLAEGIRQVGERFERLEIFLTDLVMAGEAMQAAVAFLRTKIKPEDLAKTKKGTVVIGTVKGDVHSIGKNILASLLMANGYEVHDLGVDVISDDFVDKAEETHATVIALSALLSSTMREQEEIISILNEEGIRDKYIVVVGGSPISQDYADQIGADGFAPDALSAIRLINKLVSKKKLKVDQNKKNL